MALSSHCRSLSATSLDVPSNATWVEHVPNIYREIIANDPSKEIADMVVKHFKSWVFKRAERTYFEDLRSAERQVIVTWYKPEEKLPPDGMYRYVTFSGETKGHIYYHAMGVAKCFHGWMDEPPVWVIKGLDIHDCVNCIIEAWADLEPFDR